MRLMKRITCALCVCIGIGMMMPINFSYAADMSAASRAEVDALLNHLANSGCQFNRNGTWYSAPEARVHLNKKLDYLVQKHLASTTEQFIDAAASKSSMSGKSYQVKCGNEPAQESAVWLQAALKELRNKKAAAAK